MAISLYKLHLTDNVKSIKEGAFTNCPLADLHLPDNLDTIVEYQYSVNVLLYQ